MDRDDNIWIYWDSFMLLLIR